MGSYSKTTKERMNILPVLSGIILSVVTSLVLILLFALMIKWFEWGDGVITPFNIAIKIISIAVGVFVATKDGKNGLKKGAVVGVFYIMLSFLIFSILLGSFSLSVKFLWDLLLGLLGGVILGVMCVNLKK